MKTKKPKSIEDELIDELLEDEGSTSFSLSEDSSIVEAAASLADDGAPADLVEEPTSATYSKTIKIADSNENQSSPKGSTGILNSISRIVTPRSKGGATAVGMAEATLVQADNLRIAQDRISEFEEEIEKLREENMKLATAGEALNNQTDELLARNSQLENKISEDKKNTLEEISLLQGLIKQKEKEKEEVVKLNNAMETRLDTNLRKIRLRERELENRLEILKMESQSILNSKNKIILDLKKEVDQYDFEMENFRSKGLELNKKLEVKQETFKKAIKTLKIALSLLDGQVDIHSDEKEDKAS